MVIIICSYLSVDSLPPPAKPLLPIHWAPNDLLTTTVKAMNHSSTIDVLPCRRMAILIESIRRRKYGEAKKNEQCLLATTFSVASIFNLFAERVLSLVRRVAGRAPAHPPIYFVAVLLCCRQKSQVRKDRMEYRNDYCSDNSCKPIATRSHTHTHTHTNTGAFPWNL